MRRIFQLSSANFFLLGAWLFCALHFSQLISGNITVRLSITIPSKQIETLQELFDSGMNLVVTRQFRHLKGPLIEKIKNKTEQDETMLPNRQLFENKKWIVDTSYGRSAIFMYEMPLKSIAIKHSKSLKPNTKFRFIEERYSLSNPLTCATNRRLPIEFRTLLNLR